jgi:ubiquinone/menaquinone biosynthesis C-methylase UbiE
MNLYKFLENPFFYRLVVKIFSIGGRARKIGEFIDQVMARECRGRILEVGSGTSQFRETFLKYVDNYVITDINFQYMQYSQSTHPGLGHVVCDATRLSFPPALFDRVFSLYLFHHLSDQQTRDSLKEMRRCLAPGGKIVIVDLFQTERRWDLVSRGVAWLDRGQFVRPRASMRALIQEAGNFQVEESHGVPGDWPYSMSEYLLTPAA